mgnify:FL=1
MGSYTPNKGLYKADPIADAKDTFNITKMLNDNWDKLDVETQSFNDLMNAYSYTWSMSEADSGALTITVMLGEDCPKEATMTAVITEAQNGDTTIDVTTVIDGVTSKSSHTINDAGGEGGVVNG